MAVAWIAKGHSNEPTMVIERNKEIQGKEILIPEK
jgi:hypothetical protein